MPVTEEGFGRNTQEGYILNLFETYRTHAFTADEVRTELFNIGKVFPLTSVRRALTNLLKAEKIFKLGKRPGQYGVNTTTWKLA